MFRRLTSLILVAALSMSCATVRLEYRADLELADGAEGEVTYARSYDTSGHMVACIITGVIYGGWCWAYAFMPYGAQEREVIADAQSFIKSQVEKNHTLIRPRVLKRGYNNMPLEQSIVYLAEEADEDSAKGSTNRKKSRGKVKKVASRDALRDELRDSRWKEYQQSTRQFHNGSFAHYGAIEAHFNGLGLLYGKSLGRNLHFNLNYFSAKPTQIFSSRPIRLTDLEATMRLHFNAFYMRLGAGYRKVFFEGGDNEAIWFADDKVYVQGDVTSLGGVLAMGIDVTDGAFFYGVEIFRIHSPWSKLNSNLEFTANDSTSETGRERFTDKAAKAESGDLLKVKIGIIIH